MSERPIGGKGYRGQATPPRGVMLASSREAITNL